MVVPLKKLSLFACLRLVENRTFQPYKSNAISPALPKRKVLSARHAVKENLDACGRGCSGSRSNSHNREDDKRIQQIPRMGKPSTGMVVLQGILTPLTLGLSRRMVGRTTHWPKKKTHRDAWSTLDCVRKEHLFPPIESVAHSTTEKLRKTPPQKRLPPNTAATGKARRNRDTPRSSRMSRTTQALVDATDLDTALVGQNTKCLWLARTPVAPLTCFSGPDLLLCLSDHQGFSLCPQ